MYTILLSRLFYKKRTAAAALSVSTEHSLVFEVGGMKPCQLCTVHYFKTTDSASSHNYYPFGALLVPY
jgi:hypothetical protein